MIAVISVISNTTIGSGQANNSPVSLSSEERVSAFMESSDFELSPVEPLYWRMLCYMIMIECKKKRGWGEL